MEEVLILVDREFIAPAYLANRQPDPNIQDAIRPFFLTERSMGPKDDRNGESKISTLGQVGLSRWRRGIALIHY